jgi:hypothetical protein
MLMETSKRMEKPEQPERAVPNRETPEFTALGTALPSLKSFNYGFGSLAVQYAVR